MTPEKQERIAQETLDIYAPLANRLGIQWIKTELEDLSFTYLQAHRVRRARRSGWPARPRSARSSSTRWSSVIQAQARRERAPGRGLRPVQAPLLASAGRCSEQDIDFEQIHDVIAFRVIVRLGGPVLRGAGAHPLAVEAGAGALQGLHRHPQAQHVPVAPHHGDRPAGERIEMQIRTEEMHRIAEEGIAAHWAYKERAATEGAGASAPATTRSSPGCGS